MTERLTTISDRASETLETIRRTMARSAAFTAVPGRGGMVMGAIGLIAAVLSSRQGTPRAWLAVWLTAAAIACPFGVEAMRRKARAVGLPAWSDSSRRFAQALAPSLLAGAALTLDAALEGREARLPGPWLLLYGAGILAGSTASLRVLTTLGALLMGLGVAAILSPAGWGTWYLAAGFGGLQIVFGFLIARRHGG